MTHVANGATARDILHRPYDPFRSGPTTARAALLGRERPRPVAHVFSCRVSRLGRDPGYSVVEPTCKPVRALAFSLVGGSDNEAMSSSPPWVAVDELVAGKATWDQLTIVATLRTTASMMTMVDPATTDSEYSHPA